MKVVIDMIEDIRQAVINDPSFMVWAMGLKEASAGDFSPRWQSPIAQIMVDEKQEKVFMMLGQTPLDVCTISEALNGMENKQMMYEVQLSYSKEKKRVDSPLLGFGENVQEKKYFLFLTE